MRKKILLVIVLALLLQVNMNVYARKSAKCFCRDNLCTNCLKGGKRELFTICNKDGNDCITINTQTIREDKKYDLFEIKNSEVYLDNSNLTLTFNNVWTALDYKFHIVGTNKITKLNSFNVRKYEDPLAKKEYPEVYTSDYIPFQVYGDGTLEIEKIDHAKTNSKGDLYFKEWGSLSQVSIDEGRGTVSIRPLKNITIQDVKDIFDNDVNSLVFYEFEGTMSLDEYNQKKDTIESPVNIAQIDGDDITTKEGRAAFIDRLYAEDILVYDQVIMEQSQITASWGQENIRTELSRSFSKTGSYLINFKEEKDMITTTRTDNIVFESTEEFDPNYHLVVDDITENITDTQSTNVQANTDKTLLELYDIYMADENNNIVKMEDGTYTIKVELNDMLKKYKNYQIIYISDDDKVELIEAKVDGNHIIFNTTHLSKYGVIGTEIKNINTIASNPQTADGVVTYVLAFISLFIGIIIVSLRIKKLKTL